MLTTLFYHWCEARFLAEGIPCPGAADFIRLRAGEVIRLGRSNQTAVTVRFDKDTPSAGNIDVVVEEWDNDD